MKTARLVPILFPLIAACGPHQMAVTATIGGPEVALKQPIADRCAAATLQGCPDLVDGSITYLGGDKVKGKDTLTRAAAQNAPEKVKSFADQIRQLPLGSFPGTSGFAPTIIEIADILAGVQVVAAVPPPPAPPAPPPPPADDAPQVVLQGMTLQGAQFSGIPEIEFETGRAAIKPTSANETVLRLVLMGGQQNPQVSLLRVEGHTDSDGDINANQLLSEARARAVVEWFVAHGADPHRLHAVGCGSRTPLFPNDTPEHKARNRRTEFYVEQYNGRHPRGFTEACTTNTFRTN
ncbi:MAG: OmpA family protein [Polyangiaceae bacterium]|jgi:OOP family OmpA-OmpF porin